MKSADWTTGLRHGNKNRNRHTWNLKSATKPHSNPTQHVNNRVWKQDATESLGLNNIGKRIHSKKESGPMKGL